MPTAPLVTVLMAVHDGEPFLRPAVESVLRQTMSDLELLVVDDASTDGTPSILASVDDPRLRVVRNGEQRGLAASLNRGLDEARAAFVARLDADDVSTPRRLELQLRRLASAPDIAVVGSAALEMNDRGQLGPLHVMPGGTRAVRFSALFSAPFFHPSVLVDRAVLERNGLRYDVSFPESEDYELWVRLLDVADGDNLPEPLVLYRVHAEQASRRRHSLQRSLQRQVALGSISNLGTALSAQEVELAWRVGTGQPVGSGQVENAAEAYLALVGAFERRHGHSPRSRVARDLVRLARRAPGSSMPKILKEAARVDPALVPHVARDRVVRRRVRERTRNEVGGLLASLELPASERPIRVAAIFPEPTPYRTPLLDRVAALDEIELSVIYAAPSVVAGRTFSSEGEHDATVLRGFRVPGGERVVRHDYPVTPGIVRVLDRVRPDVVVVSGWSTFAAQGAIAWCRLRDVPYVLVVESHDEGPRPGWRRKVKGTVVPRLVRGASGVLVTGTLARSSMISRGARPERIRVFANTIDVEAFGAQADRLRVRRLELRSELGAGADDVLVLSVARLGPEKRLDILVQAVAAARDSRLLLVIAGEGAERETLGELVAEAGVRARFVGDVEWARIVELYVSADVFAMVSERETWGVVVNEAAACGLPLVLSDRVGAAHDLLRDGENGVLVPAGDVSVTAAALRELAGDAERRREMGARSRELARDWGYGPSVEGFAAAVREAIADRR
jgi:glycosyltransferase involved in cell wall biosynthesis